MADPRTDFHARVALTVHDIGGDNGCDGPRRVVLTAGVEFVLSKAEAIALSKALYDAATRPMSG